MNPDPDLGTMVCRCAGALLCCAVLAPSPMVVLGAVVAVLSWNTGIKAVGPVNGVLFINLVPVVAFLIGVVQGHAFGRAEVLGAALVIAALLANNLYGRWRRAPVPAPRDEAVLCEEV